MYYFSAITAEDWCFLRERFASLAVVDDEITWTLPEWLNFLRGYITKRDGADPHA